MANRKINTSRFYFEWKGHTIPDITTFHSTTISQRPNKPIIYLTGDSSFDNKYWVPSSGPGGEPLPVEEVPEIYQATLDRPHPKPDIAFWLNHFLGDRATALNLAVEESMLREREGGLLEHDCFVRDHLGADDVLIISIGANDIALKPTLSTMRHMVQLAWLTPRTSLEEGTATSLSHFIKIFKTDLEIYISRLISKQKPRAVIVCMIYYPLQSNLALPPNRKSQKGWADIPLKLLGYNRFPGQLQLAIRKMYELATCRIRVEGGEGTETTTRVLTCPLFEVMDGRDSGDYVARVEPSVEGGRKIAELLMGRLEELIGNAEVAGDGV